MKYIPAEKLITILEERKAQRYQWYERYGDTVDGAKANELSEVIDIISSLQQEQPEVDIWKEIHKYFNPYGMELQFDRSKGNTILKPEQLFNFARHFWNKGYNARKEK